MFFLPFSFFPLRPICFCVFISLHTSFNHLSIIHSQYKDWCIVHNQIQGYLLFLITGNRNIFLLFFLPCFDSINGTQLISFIVKSMNISSNWRCFLNIQMIHLIFHMRRSIYNIKASTHTWHKTDHINVTNLEIQNQYSQGYTHLVIFTIYTKLTTSVSQTPQIHKYYSPQCRSAFLSLRTIWSFMSVGSAQVVEASTRTLALRIHCTIQARWQSHTRYGDANSLREQIITFTLDLHSLLEQSWLLETLLPGKGWVHAWHGMYSELSIEQLSWSNKMNTCGLPSDLMICKDRRV